MEPPLREFGRIRTSDRRVRMIYPYEFIICSIRGGVNFGQPESARWDAHSALSLLSETRLMAGGIFDGAWGSNWAGKDMGWRCSERRKQGVWRGWRSVGYASGCWASKAHAYGVLMPPDVSLLGGTLMRDRVRG